MFRLILGWCVVGPMQYEKSSDTSTCNRIMVTAVGQSNPANYFFAVTTEVQDNSIESMLKRMYKSDSVELIFKKNFGKFNLSYDFLFKSDKFSELMKNEIVMIHGHY